MLRLDEVLAQTPKTLPETALSEIGQWLDGHISRPHPELGRTGDVCPWTRRSAELKALHLDLCLTLDKAAVDAQLLNSMRRFLAAASEGVGAFRAIVTVFPQRDEATERFIVQTHARLKPTFLANKLMLGEFYPSCEKPGLRNPSFRPLRAPWPLLVIRPMVEGDIEFLHDREEFITAYLKAQGRRGRERFELWLRDNADALEPERRSRLRQLLGREQKDAHV